MNNNILARIYVWSFLFCVAYDNFIGVRFFPTFPTFIYGLIMFTISFIYIAIEALEEDKKSEEEHGAK